MTPVHPATRVGKIRCAERADTRYMLSSTNNPQMEHPSRRNLPIEMYRQDYDTGSSPSPGTYRRTPGRAPGGWTCTIISRRRNTKHGALCKENARGGKLFSLTTRIKISK